MEADFVAVLQTQCPRVFADVAPTNTATPYITWQLIGGRSLGWLDGSPADKRHTFVQVNVWAGTRKESMTLIRAVELALRTSPAFRAWPDAEPMTDLEYDMEPPRYGAMQDYQVYSTR